MKERKDDNGKERFIEWPRSPTAIPRYVRNPSYGQSVLLGLRFGLWDLPANLLESVFGPLIGLLCLTFFVPAMLVITLVYAFITVIAGCAGCVSPPEGTDQ